MHSCLYTHICGKHFCQTLTKLYSGGSRGKMALPPVKSLPHIAPWPQKCSVKCLCFIITVHVIVTMHRYASLYIVKLRFDNLFNNIRIASLCDNGVYGDNYLCQVCDPHLKLYSPHFPAAVLNITYRMWIYFLLNNK